MLVMAPPSAGKARPPELTEEAVTNSRRSSMGKSTVRLRCFAVLATTSAVLGLGVQAASASVPAKQLAEWKSVDGTFNKANSAWTSALESMSANTPVSKLSKSCLAFVPAVKTFDTAIKKIGFTGKTGTDIASLIKVNNKLIPILGHVTSIKSFESQFSPLESQYMGLQAALSKDLGIEEAEIYV
jgi:hypothetical protein